MILASRWRQGIQQTMPTIKKKNGNQICMIARSRQAVSATFKKIVSVFYQDLLQGPLHFYQDDAEFKNRSRRNG
jgi:hypothetical protein